MIALLLSVVDWQTVEIYKVWERHKRNIFHPIIMHQAIWMRIMWPIATRNSRNSSLQNTTTVQLLCYGIQRAMHLALTQFIQTENKASFSSHLFHGTNTFTRFGTSAAAQHTEQLKWHQYQRTLPLYCNGHFLFMNHQPDHFTRLQLVCTTKYTFSSSYFFTLSRCVLNWFLIKTVSGNEVFMIRFIWKRDQWTEWKEFSANIDFYLMNRKCAFSLNSQQ